MEFLWPILAKIELICQQTQVSGVNPSSGVPERMTGGWWGGLAMVARQKRQSKLGLWNSLCTTEPTLLEVIKWVSKVHYAHIQLDDEVTSNIVFFLAMKSRTGSVDVYPIPCNPQFQLQQTNHSQDLWHQVDLLRYRVNHSIFYTSH